MPLAVSDPVAIIGAVVLAAIGGEAFLRATIALSAGFGCPGPSSRRNGLIVRRRSLLLFGIYGIFVWATLVAGHPSLRR